jgi:hypothetical protein
MFPISVRIRLVDKYGALLSTVTSEIRLRIAIDIQLAHHPSSLDGNFQIAVRTVLPFQVTSRGRPTFSDNSRAIYYVLLNE